MWRVTLDVRKRGAIGSFYPRGFDVEAPENISTGALYDAWAALYGDLWEYGGFRVASYQSAPDGAPIASTNGLVK